MSLRGGRSPTTLAPHCVWCSAGAQSQLTSNGLIGCKPEIATLAYGSLAMT